MVIAVTVTWCWVSCAGWPLGTPTRNVAGVDPPMCCLCLALWLGKTTTTELRASLSELFLLGFLLFWAKELGSLPSSQPQLVLPPPLLCHPHQLTLVGEKRKRIFRKCIRVQIRKITRFESQFSHFADREQMFVIHHWSGRFFGKS